MRRKSNVFAAIRESVTQKSPGFGKASIDRRVTRMFVGACSRAPSGGPSPAGVPPPPVALRPIARHDHPLWRLPQVLQGFFGNTDLDPLPTLKKLWQVVPQAVSFL